jgi:hypothetical protein
VYTTSTWCDYGGVDDEEDDHERRQKGQQSQKDRLPLHYSSTHIVKPALMWCLCSIWQDTLLPCQHMCAGYCKSKSADKNYILANLINEYYTNGCAQKTFKRNIYPVGVDTLAYNGETTPPLGSKRSSGQQELNSSGNEVYKWRQTVVKQDTTRDLILQKKRQRIAYRVQYQH